MKAQERDQLARKIRCPKCRAQPYFACTRAAVRVTYLKRPHRERVDAALAELEKPENPHG